MTDYRPVDTSRLFEKLLSRRQAAKWLAGGTALGLSGALTRRQFAAAQATPVGGLLPYPQVTIVAEDSADGKGYVFGAPASLPTGYVKVTLVNSSTDATHHAMFMRPNQGVTPQQFMATAKSTSNLGALFAQAKSIGGPGSIDPGQNSTVILNLEEGPYVLICAVPGPNGMPHYQMGMMTEVDAKPSGTPVTTPPTEDTSVDLVDFAFKDLESTVPAGQHIWKVSNTGQQLHEMAIFALAPGFSADQFLKILESSEAPATPTAGTPAMAMPAATPVAASPAASPAAGGPPPAVDVDGVAPMNPGETNWLVADFQPGNYAAACFVPDPATGKPHFMLGMFMGFTVQ